MDINLFLKALSSQEKAALMIKLQMQLDEEKKQAAEMENLEMRNLPEETLNDWYMNHRDKMTIRLYNGIGAAIDADFIDANTPITDITLNDIKKIRNIGTSSLIEFKRLRGY